MSDLPLTTKNTLRPENSWQMHPPQRWIQSGLSNLYEPVFFPNIIVKSYKIMSSYKSLFTFNNHDFFLDENVNFMGQNFKIFPGRPIVLLEMKSTRPH